MDFHGRVLRLCAATNFQSGDFESALALAKKSLRFTKDGAYVSCPGGKRSYTFALDMSMCVLVICDSFSKTPKRLLPFQDDNPATHSPTARQYQRRRMRSYQALYECIQGLRLHQDLVPSERKG